MKVGQYPAPDVSISKSLEKELGEYGDLYRKGRTSEQFGYGIAAHAYYRRVIELMIDRLMAIVESLITEETKHLLEPALEKAATSHHATDRIKLVKDLLPLDLHPDGMNPLGIIYGALSEGIHEQSDEACLLNATKIRTALTYLIEEIAPDKLRRQAFIEAMREIKNPNPSKP